MSLEAKCHALVKRWRRDSNVLVGAFKGDNYASIILEQACQLEAILPQRRPKKRKRKATR